MKKYLFLTLSLSIAQISYAQKKPLLIQDQGSFAIGGSVITNPGTFDPIKRTPEGQTFHGDHAFVRYQIPVKAHKYPLVFGMESGMESW